LTHQDNNSFSKPSEEESFAIERLVLYNDYPYFVVWIKQNIRPQVHSVLSAKFSASLLEIDEVYKSTRDDVTEDLLNNQFQGRSQLSTYFISVAIHKMAKLIRRKIQERDYIEKCKIEINNSTDSDDDLVNLHPFIEQMKDPCKLILLGYLDGQSLNSLSLESEYSYSHLKNSKTPCMAQLKEILLKNGFKF
jgi:hypothetical protein